MITKLSRGFIIMLLLSTIIIYPSPQVLSQTDYTEEISATIIGDTAFWEINMKGSNIGITGLEDIETEIDDISSYQLFTLDSSKWVPEDEFFSSSAYNLIGFDVIPTSEVFLKVVSNNLQSATKLADSFSQFFHLRFIIFSLSDNEFIFYSHMEFNLIQEKLWNAIPVDYGGSATLIDKDLFMFRDVPIFKFSGEKSSDGFIHSVTIGGLQRNAVNQQKFSLQNIFTSIEDTPISSEAASSTISINIINGFVSFSGDGEVTNFLNNQSATIIVNLEPEDTFPVMDVDIIQSFPSVIVIRDVDKATLNQNDIVTVGVKVKNIAPMGSAPITHISINEDWWNIMDTFEFVDGETNRTLGHLAPQGEFTLAYRLRVVSSDKEEIVIPQDTISYLYNIQNGEVQNTATFNKLTLILNDIKPVIDITASIETSNPPILGTIPVNLTIQNNGNGHATNLEIEGQTKQSLLAGDIWSLSVNVSSNSLIYTNSLNIWHVTWTDGDEQKIESSNSITLNYNMTGNNIPQFEIIRNIIHTVDEESHKFNETIMITNIGDRPLEHIFITEQKPEKIEFLNGNYSLNENILEATSENIETGYSITYQYTGSIMDLNDNYILLPPIIIIESSGLQITRLAKSIILPLGVTVSKIIDSTTNFVGASISIDSKVLNTGNIPIFNIGLIIGEDIFSEIVEGEPTYSTEILNQDENLSAINKVMLLGAGNFETVNATVVFIMAGTPFVKYSEATPITVYAPLIAELTVDTSTPIEGQEFTISLTIKNPTEIDVKNVKINMDIPDEIQIIEGSIELNGENLDANSEIIKNAKIIVDTSHTILIETPNVEYQYNGETLNGTSNSLVISIGDNIQIRYSVPILIAIFLMIGTAFVIRKLIISK